MQYIPLHFEIVTFVHIPGTLGLFSRPKSMFEVSTSRSFGLQLRNFGTGLRGSPKGGHGCVKWNDRVDLLPKKRVLSCLGGKPQHTRVPS